MRVGILTFHWATNYGAVLQAFCLQQYLSQKGHQVDIINYKPSQYDFSWRHILCHPKSWGKIFLLLKNKKKETLIKDFREKYLNCTPRYKTAREIELISETYEVVISGSDQVLNPSFLLFGENNSSSKVYWLNFGSKYIKRLGYAVSFGCEQYPEKAAEIASLSINGFTAIGTRELTGLNILDQLNYRGEKCLVPDPTILLGIRLFEQIGINPFGKKEDYTCVYMLRHVYKIEGEARYIDDNHNPMSLEEWLQTIVHARSMITNSYHGMIMAILSHTPFVVIHETGNGKGMNDRFNTILAKLGIESRVVSCIEEAYATLQEPIDFNILDNSLRDYREIGERFLEKNLC